MLFIRFSQNLLCTGHICSFMYSNLKIFSKDLPESNLMSEKNYEMRVGWGLGWEERNPSIPLFSRSMLLFFGGGYVKTAELVAMPKENFICFERLHKN